MMQMGASRLAAAMSFVLQTSGLGREDFERLPRFAPPRSGRTLDRFHALARKNRYTGAMLRQIRATGQARECARRRGQAVAA